MWIQQKKFQVLYITQVTTQFLKGFLSSTEQYMKKMGDRSGIQIVKYYQYMYFQNWYFLTYISIITEINCRFNAFRVFGATTLALSFGSLLLLFPPRCSLFVQDIFFLLGLSKHSVQTACCNQSQQKKQPHVERLMKYMASLGLLQALGRQHNLHYACYLNHLGHTQKMHHSIYYYGNQDKIRNLMACMYGLQREREILVLGFLQFLVSRREIGDEK